MRFESTKKFRNKFIMLCMLLGCCMVTSCHRTEVKNTVGLFSWKSEALTDEDFLEVAQSIQATEVYQAISKSTDKAVISDYLSKLSESGIAVYALYGEREWALDSDGTKMCEMISRVQQMNQQFLENEEISQENAPHFKGIVFDVEPYLLKEWKADSQAVMNSFVQGLHKAYETKGNLEVYICIPYYYDTKGLEEGLDNLIADCCDGVLVMNYYRDKEEKHILKEYELCKKYQKKIVTIYEMRRADDSGREEISTYHDLGIEAVLHNYKTVRESLSDYEMGLAYHDYNGIKEVLHYE